MEVYMIDFVKGAFRGFFVFTLWVCLIGCVIGAAIIGGSVLGVGGVIIGIIIGVLVGLMIVITGGGLVATLLNMDENLEIIATNISKTGINSQASQENISDSGNRSFVGNKRQKKCKRCKREIDEDYSGCPHCGNNTFE
jgi:hypothetical protein